MTEQKRRAWIYSAMVTAIVAAGAALHHRHRRDPDLIRDHRYAIDRNELLPGDILLFRNGAKSATSTAIRWWTASPYSHAAIYLGDDQILEAVVPGIRITPLRVRRSGYVAVIRSQMGFGASRVEILRDFADQLVKQKARYDLSGVLKFVGMRDKTYQENIEAVLSGAEDIRGSKRTKYFCSALVARIWCVVGIMDQTAWSLMLKNLIAPGDIPSDVNFGWFLGYLIPQGTKIPEDEPMLMSTAWKDVLAA